MSFRTVFSAATIVAALVFSAPAVQAQQDAITVGTVTASGTSVDVPVFIRDVSGTPLGVDHPGSRIQAFSIKVTYAPAAAVSSVSFSRSGITTALTPTFENSPSSAGTISLLESFQESTNPIPFNLNAAAPGDKVAHLVFNLSASAAPGSSISLTLDTAVTDLINDAGTTSESQGNGNLLLVNGAINIPQLSVVLTPSPLTAQLHSSTTLMTATFSAAQPSAISVNLTSSNPSIATVPATVTVPAGSTSASFVVNPLAVGQTTITATLPPANGGGTSQATLNVIPPTINIAPFTSTVPLGGSSLLTLSISTPQPSDTAVSMTSSDPTVATVPATVTIPAGQPNVTFTVNGLKLGSASLHGTLPAALGSGPASANVDVSSVCITPTPPTASVPADASSGASYDVTWPAVSSATEYLLDESTAADFSNATTKSVTTTSATFSHAVTADTRYYYRVRARNHGGACDNTSASSTAVSIVVHAGVAPLVRILPVVGSLPGANGSFFKTSVQLYNPRNVSITGKILYHPSGVSGSDSDPSLTYALAPGKTITYADLLPAMSRSGLGTADIIGDPNSPLPVASVRVFNDAGVLGTSGLGEEPTPPEAALQGGDSAVVIAPTDFAKFRLNIGIRTLAAGASMTITVRDKDGLTLKSLDKSYDPTFFTQPGSATLLDGLVLTGGETLTFTLHSGSAIIYGSITDNTTNDPSIQVATKL